jgi:Glycosyltransferase family 92
LIEWIELNQILGFSHFYFYDRSISKEVACILKEYVARGVATVTRWDGSRPNNQGRIRENNMYGTFNDCLYRNMYNYKYLSYFDVDEFLVPKKHENLIDLMEDMDKKEKNMASASFRNVFFYRQRPDGPNTTDTKLNMMKKTSRNLFIHPDGTRSKFICKPTEVVEPGVHVLLETRTSQMKQVTVDLDLGFMHHYRSSCEKSYPCLKLKSKVDTSIWKWKKVLTEAMEKQNIAQLCKLRPR